MSKFGIVAALAAEAHCLGTAPGGRAALSPLPGGALLAISGIGYAAAALAARRLADAGVTALLSWGMAGGLDPGLRAGSVVLPSEVIGADGSAFATAFEWREALLTAVESQLPASRGKLLTSPQAIASVAAKAAAFRATGAAAVDMESLAIAEIAAARGLPFIAVRVIVDTAGDSLPRSILAASSGGPLRIWRLVGGLAAAPADVADLLRLMRRYRAARRALAAIARSAMLGPPSAGKVTPCRRRA